MGINDDNIILESVADEVDKAYRNVVNLWHHMLKWDHQRYIQSPSWSTSINNRANDIKAVFTKKNSNTIERRLSERLNDAYDDAVDMTISIAIKEHRYMTSKIPKTIQNDYKLDYILDDNNRYKWIHTKCGNRLLSNNSDFKYDTIKETDVRIDPKDALK